jgi:hypothetical protein
VYHVVDGTCVCVLIFIKLYRVLMNV